MTIAVDIKTGAVVGQVLDERLSLPGHALPDRAMIFVLCKDGYRRIARGSVRLERVSSD
jgi:hypothetical protein